MCSVAPLFLTQNSSWRGVVTLLSVNTEPEPALAIIPELRLGRTLPITPHAFSSSRSAQRRTRACEGSRKTCGPPRRSNTLIVSILAALLVVLIPACVVSVAFTVFAAAALMPVGFVVPLSRKVLPTTLRTVACVRTEWAMRGRRFQNVPFPRPSSIA